ncbi:MAG: pirin family protein [Candidatus Xenobia bacterium]
MKTIMQRKVAQSWSSVPTMEGAGVHLRRGIGFAREHQQLFDPFLMLDDFRGEKPADFQAGFPWHPHRGMETITYVLEGEVEHGDSMGNRGVIGPGDVQWMTAGSGIIHQEMPKGDERGRMGGFQLWSNLPAGQKMMDPRYRELRASYIPVVTTPEGAVVRVVAGSVEGEEGPMRDIVSDPEYLDVTVPAGKAFTHPVKAGHTVFAYVFEGEGTFGDSRFGNHTVVLYGAEGDHVQVTADSSPVRFLLVSGRPLREPVAWRGPIVMNTQAELRAAFEELERGTFVKRRP